MENKWIEIFNQIVKDKKMYLEPVDIEDDDRSYELMKEGKDADTILIAVY